MSDPRNILNPAFQFESSITDSIQKEVIDRYFGYDFFTNKDSIAFWESLPLSSDYILGPGDEVVISLWGETQLRKTYVISKDGKIFDDKVGVLFISGKSIVDVKNYLKDQFSTKYSTLSGAKPSSFIDITLGELRSINVSFVGEVHNPGQYPIHSLSNLITSLMQIGGIDTSGTLREIKIIRDNETFANIDLYKFLLRGEINDDIQLLDQDIVLVSMRNSTVEIDSSIARPGIYEMLPNETLGDLIKFAGGFTPFSSKNIIVNRLNYSRDEKAYLGPENYYLDYTSSKNFTIENGDRVIVRKIETFTKKVEIVGQVKRPGVYGFFDGMNVKNLLEIAGGLSDSTFIKSMHLDQAEVIRMNPNTSYEKVIPINLNDYLNGSPKPFFLQNLDKLVVHSNLNYFERKNIFIGGEVKVPGYYPLIRDDENLQSIINRAGGITSKALKNGITIFRDRSFFEGEIQNESYENNTINNDLNNNWIRVAWSSTQIPLMPGDSIDIKRSTGTVNVTGEIYNPGLVEFKKGKSVRYYLNSAGGITGFGDKKGIIVIYGNGIVVPYRFLNSNRVPEGSTIIVKRKPESLPLI